MLVIVPVSSHDAPLSRDFCNIINFFSPYAHDLLVVSRPSDRAHAENVFQKISACFKKSSLYLFPVDGPSGWPEGPNFYWVETITYLKSKDNRTPWFWMELDTTPIDEGWLDALEDEYQHSRKDCLGVLQKNFASNSRHLVGVAVYPARLDLICDSWKSCMAVNIAFDFWCQGELVPRSAQSNVLFHFFRTEDYRCTNLGLRGIDKTARPYGVRYDGVVPRNAMIVHGCIDGSLARLILNE